MKPAAPLIPVLALIGLSACGTHPTTSADRGANTQGATTPAPPAGLPRTVAVTMKNITFSPAQINIKVGQTVVWSNQDSVEHNVTAENAQTFKSSTFGPGGSFKYTANVPGTFPYVCTIHPNMTATLVVRK